MSIEASDLEATDGLNPAPGNLGERTPSDIERQVMNASPDASLDELSAALDAAEWLLARAKTIDRLIRQIAIDWVDRNGEFNIGDMHYWVGFATAVKCLNVPQTGLAVLEAAAGDMDRLFGVLVAQPFKHASVRDVIDKKIYNSLFTTYRTAKLVNGVPERALKQADKHFLPKSQHVQGSSPG